MEKLKAFLAHFLLSAIICVPVFYLIYFIWYPSPFLEMQGGETIFLFLILSTVILGPLLIFVVFKSGKKGLLFDFIVIITIQLIALIYGTYTLYLERPLYVVFNIDRFNLVSVTSINTKELQDNSLKVSLFEKAKFIYIEIPNDAQERMDITFEAISGGKDFFQRPIYYRQYQVFSDNINSNSYSLSLKNILKFHPDLAGKIKNIAKINNLTLHELLFYPFVGRKNDSIIILQKGNAKKIAILEDIDPWKIKF